MEEYQIIFNKIQSLYQDFLDNKNQYTNLRKELELQQLNLEYEFLKNDIKTLYKYNVLSYEKENYLINLINENYQDAAIQK